MRTFTNKKETQKMQEVLKANNMCEKYFPDYALIRFPDNHTELKRTDHINESEEVLYYSYSISYLLNILPPKISGENYDLKLCVVGLETIGYYKETYGCLVPGMTLHKDLNMNLIESIIEFISHIFETHKVVFS